MSQLFPIYMDLQGERCLVVGGGKIAFRKAKALLEAGSRVDLISPEVLEEIEALVREWPQTLRLERTRYETRPLQAYTLIIAATDEQAVNEQVYADARAAKVLVNVVDQPPLCSFHVPAVAREGKLQYAISTGGCAPALAARLRYEKEKELEPWMGHYLEALQALRQQVTESLQSPMKRKRFWYDITAEAVREHVRGLEEKEIFQHLKSRLMAAIEKGDA